MMNSIPRTMSIFLLAGAMAGLAFAQTSSDARSTEPRQGVLVLHKGQVLEGKITRSGDLYHVILPQGEIRIRANKVAYQCDSLEEAYRRRREAITVGNADEHIELARWCQRNGLLSAAARELADAMAANPDNPWIPQLERSLKAAMKPLRPSAIDPANQQSNAPSGEELDQMVRRMPSGSVEAFKSTIQPLLINSCTAGGCHGPQSADRFRLLRGRAGHGPSRRATQRNLHATLAMIDRGQPEKSPLLIEAMRVHGTTKKPALGIKDTQKFRQIVQWVYQVAQTDHLGKPIKPTPNKATDPGEPLIGQTSSGKQPAVMAAAWPNETHKATSSNSANRFPTSRFPASRSVPPDVARPGFDRPDVQRGAKIKRFVPVDPFDPEIFNRRYHRDETPKADPS